MATPASSTVGACVWKDLRMAPWFWRHCTITPARWRCSPQESRPKVCKAAGLALGAAAQAKWELAWRKPRKSTSFYFLLICSVFNVAGTEPFASPIPGEGTPGRRRPPVLPSSVLRCLIAGEFGLVLSSAFRLFQAYRPMYAWSGFSHVSSSPTQKRGKRHSSGSHGNISDPNELPFLIFLLDSNKIHFVLIFLFSLIFFLLFSVSAYLVLSPSTEGQ